MLKVDSLGIWNVKSVQPTVFLLSHSPKINLNRLIDSTRATCIIADGSNYRLDIKRWRETCKTRHIKFHSTREDGFIKLSSLN